MIASSLTRRTALMGPLVAIAGALVARNAFATADQAKEWLAGHARGTPQSGKVTLKAPEIAENGNAVPLTVKVDSPMTADDHVKAIHIFNEKNPQPHVFNAWLSPANGQARVATRIKLGDSQKVVAVAETSKGEFWSAHTDVIVTIAACIEDAT